MSCVFIKVKARSDIWQVCKENSKSDLFSSNWQVKAVFDASIVRRFSTNIIWRVMNSFDKNTHTQKGGVWWFEGPSWPINLHSGKSVAEDVSSSNAEPLSLFGRSCGRQRPFDEAKIQDSCLIIRPKTTLLQPACRLCMADRGPVYSNDCLSVCRGNFRMQSTWQWWRLTRGSEHSGEQEIQETFMFSC